MEKAGVCKMTYLALRHMLVKEMLAAGMKLEKVQGSRNVAGLMTKALDAEHHEALMELLPLQRRQADREEEAAVQVVTIEEPYTHIIEDIEPFSKNLVCIIGLTTVMYHGGSFMIAQAGQAARRLTVCGRRPTRQRTTATQTEVNTKDAIIQTEVGERPTSGIRWIPPHSGEVIHSESRCRGLDSARGIRRMRLCPLCG